MLFKKLPDKVKFLFFILVPFLTYVLAEWLQGSFQSPIGFNFWLNLLFYYGFSFVLYGAFGNLFVYTAVPSILIWILGVINHYMIMLRSKALLPWELAALNTAKTVDGNFDIPIDATTILSVSVLILICVIAFFLRKSKFFKSRIYTSASGVLMLCILWTVLWASPAFISTDANDVNASRRNGLAVNVLHTLNYLANPEPEDYSPEKVREIVGNNEKDGTMKPDIIVIMDESFADLSTIADLNEAEDFIPFFHSVSDNAITGNARVSVFGGGTCTTEYEFLTGNAAHLLRPGSYPMVQFVEDKSPSIAQSLKAQGYRTIGLHSFYPDCWSRDTAYPKLGFDEFLSIKDFDDPEMVRDYISDGASFDKIIELLEEDSSPAFIFNVTMQNHFGYDRAYKNLDENAIFPEKNEFPRARRYFSLLSLTDEALSDLVDYLKERERPTILLFFGDHLPSFEQEYYDILQNRAGLTDEEMEVKKHTVPFFIWANYPIKEVRDLEISASFLSPLLLDTAGVSMTEHQTYLLDLMKKMPIWEKGDKENLDGYKMVQYNMIFDKEHKQGDLFQ